MKATNIIRTLLVLAILATVPAFARESINCENQAVVLSQDMTLDPWYHHNIVTLMALGGTRYIITEDHDDSPLTLVVNGYVRYCIEKHNRISAFRIRMATNTGSG